MKTKFCLMTFEDYIGMKKRIKQLEEVLREIAKITNTALKQMKDEEDLYWVKEMADIDIIAQKALEEK